MGVAPTREHDQEFAAANLGGALTREHAYVLLLIANVQALRDAERARYLGLDRELGSLEPGKLADLIVLDRDPLEDIRNSQSLRLVMANGRLYQAETLEEVGTRRRPAPVLPWQRDEARHR